MAKAKYQLLGKLRKEERAALKADIVKRGVLVPIEVDEDENILDGHNRVEIADGLGKPYKTIVRKFKTETEKREHVIKLNLARRHLDPVRWGQAFGLLIEERGVKRGRGKTNQYSASATVAEAAEELGVPKRTAERRLKQADDCAALPKKQRDAVEAGEMTLKEAKVVLRQSKKASEQEAALKDYPKGKAIHDGDLAILEDKVEDGSVMLLFTDPPYHEKHLPLFGRIAELASRKLHPDGLLLTYAGQSFLPRVVEAMGEHLEYRWIFAVKHTGPHIQIWAHKIWNDWKPVLLYGRLGGGSKHREWAMDFVEGGGKDKKYHEWGQAVQEATYWIERLTKRGDLVVDPCCGGGTILKAAQLLERAYVGSDLDKKTAAVARKRLAT